MTDARQTLRQQAEERVKKQSPDPNAIGSEETGRLLHELQVHQIELEMQNEELRRAQEEVEVSRTKYFDLYDLAPVGYLTLNEKGLILEANLIVSQMLAWIGVRWSSNRLAASSSPRTRTSITHT